MYTGLLHLHDTLRWLILLVALITIIKYYLGWFQNKKWSKPDNVLGLVFTSVFDLQFLIGLILYFFVSPVTKSIFANFGDAMKDSTLRFYAVEHFTLMLLAIAFLHIGRSKSKKASSDKKKFKAGAIYFTIALVLVLAGIPWDRI